MAEDLNERLTAWSQLLSRGMAEPHDAVQLESDLKEAADALARKDAWIAALREALQPFGYAANFWPSTESADLTVIFADADGTLPSEYDVTVDTFRRAQAALSSPPPADPAGEQP